MADDLVECVWDHAEPTFNPQQGLIFPGGTIWVTPEQAAQPSCPAQPKQQPTAYTSEDDD